MSTHIFDGLEQWGTYLAVVTDRGLSVADPLTAVDGLRRLREAGSPAPLFTFVEAALRAEKGRAGGRAQVSAGAAEQQP